MDVADRLEVKIIEAKDLISVESLYPSPYVEISVGPDLNRTKPIPETNAPVWNNPTMVFTQILGKLSHLKHQMSIFDLLLVYL